MKVHHAPNTRSVRAIWLLEELEIPYEITSYKLGDPAMRSPEYLKVHPMGRVPALEDGDVTIFESGAIVEYLISRYGAGKLRPAIDKEEFPAYLQWLHYAEGMIMPPVNTIVVETIILPPERKNEENVKRATKLLGRMLDAVEAEMADQDYLVGEFSGADIMTGHACTIARRLGADMTNKPNLEAYINRCNTRPAMQRAWEA